MKTLIGLLLALTSLCPAATHADSVALDVYLKAGIPSKITLVSVDKEMVRISGLIAGPAAGVALADIPMDVILDDPCERETLIEVKPAADGSFQTTLPRYRQRGGKDYDRLVSRWRIVRKNGESLSHARYADEVPCANPQLPPMEPRNKKGLGGWHPGPPGDDLADLGISAVTVNVMIHSLVSLTPEADTEPFDWQGRTFHARKKSLEAFDATFLEAAKHKVVVSAILLVANPAKSGEAIVKRLGHPDATPEGVFAMPNVTDEEGIALYGAILNLMAERWSRPDGKYGRVHHWILHNEVDAGRVWTNAGCPPDIVFMDLYQRSMRLMGLIAATHDPNARPFISLTHHWAKPGEPGFYGSKRMLDLLAACGRAEGDFPWALAFHPYPQDLFNPRTWEDTQATFTFQTDKITPRNLEVLDAYMKQEAFLYRGNVRPIHLSENGFNSKDYSPKCLEEQAAGMAFAWRKIQPLSSIRVWHYHNWIDNRGEGGLRIGLRKFPDEPGDPFGKKPIWRVYQSLGTPEETSAAAPYLNTIGISTWDSVIHRKPIQR